MVEKLEGSFKTWIQDGDRKRLLEIVDNKIYLDGNEVERLA